MRTGGRSKRSMNGWGKNFCTTSSSPIENVNVSKPGSQNCLTRFVMVSFLVFAKWILRCKSFQSETCSTVCFTASSPEIPWARNFSYPSSRTLRRESAAVRRFSPCPIIGSSPICKSLIYAASGCQWSLCTGPQHRTRPFPPLPELAVRNSELDLRVCRRRQNHVGDVGDDALERIPRLARKSLPLRGVSKGRPFLVPLRDALIAQHVG